MSEFKSFLLCRTLLKLFLKNPSAPYDLDVNEVLLFIYVVLEFLNLETFAGE